MSSPTIDGEAKKNYALGKEIYETKIKRLVEPNEKGKFLVLDVTTEDYAIGPDLGYTTQELLDRRPQAAMYTIRIGYPTVFKIPRVR